MLEAAARRPSAITRCMAWPRMMRSEKVSVPSAFFLMRLISPCRASIFSALLMETSSRSIEVGLTTKSTAPARMAVIAVSIEPLAVCTIMGGVDGFCAAALQDLHAADAGHHEVEQHEGDGAGVRPFQDLQGLLATLGGLGLVAETLDGLFENAALGRIVIDDQNELGHIVTTLLNQLTLHRLSQAIQNRAIQDRTAGDD